MLVCYAIHADLTRKV